MTFVNWKLQWSVLVFGLSIIERQSAYPKIVMLCSAAYGARHCSYHFQLVSCLLSNWCLNQEMDHIAVVVFFKLECAVYVSVWEIVLIFASEGAGIIEAVVKLDDKDICCRGLWIKTGYCYCWEHLQFFVLSPLHFISTSRQCEYCVNAPCWPELSFMCNGLNSHCLGCLLTIWMMVMMVN